MKRKIISIIFIICLLLTACGASFERAKELDAVLINCIPEKYNFKLNSAEMYYLKRPKEYRADFFISDTAFAGIASCYGAARQTILNYKKTEYFENTTEYRFMFMDYQGNKYYYFEIKASEMNEDITNLLKITKVR
ncbi:MAG: hypothetical protein IKI71_02085 [Lachnospiraceae bacterium]|nr:hypothetical protein [Lachnospiraceae bacterium]